MSTILPASKAARKAIVRSLAKINLDLRVLNKRSDGFHEIRTIFQTISLADSIEVSFLPARRTRVELTANIDIPNNLIIRAAEAVLEAGNAKGVARFRLEKRIPMGGGLGGGSSNAAAVLLTLPVLTARPLPLPKLIDLAAALGSDVPFFLFGGTAIGLGRGTEIYPAHEPPMLPTLLVTPGLHVSTPEAYARLNRQPGEAPQAVIHDFQTLAWELGNGGWKVVNDFEAVVFKQHPQLKSIKNRLLKLGAKPALMSGSGSTIFGIFETRAIRDHAAVSLRTELGKEKVHTVTLINRARYRSIWNPSAREPPQTHTSS